MKLNKKGMTVIELILAFALLIIIVLGMYDVIIEMKEYSSQKQIEKDLIEYKNMMIYDIESDLIELGFKSYAPDNTSLYFERGIITFNDNSTKDISIDLKEKIIIYGKTKYEIPNKEMIEFLDKDMIVTTNPHDVVISYKNNIFIIDVPYFIIDDTVNHGFKIVHPTDI